MPSQGFLDALQSAYQPAPAPSMIPGVVNTGLNASFQPPDAGAPPPSQPPPAIPPAPSAQNFSPAPPPPQVSTPNPRPPPAPAAPQNAAPTPPPGPKTLLIRGASSPAREILTKGQTALSLETRAEGTREEGVQTAADYEKQAAMNQAMAAQVRQDEAQEQVKKQAAIIAEQQRQQQEASDKVLQAAQQAKQIPITDYWADRSTGSRIMSAITIGLAGFGQSISGQQGPNPAVQMLQADMDRDLKIKQERAANQQAENKGKIDAAQQYYNNLVRNFGMSGANEMYASAQRDAVAAEVEKQAASQKILGADANAAKMVAELRASADEKKAGALKYVQASQGEDIYVDPRIGIPMTRKEIAEYRQKGALEQQQQEGRVELEGMKGATKNQGEGAKYIASAYEKAGIPSITTALDEADRLLKPRKEGDKVIAPNTKGIDPLANKLWNSGPIGRQLYTLKYGKDAASREQAWDLAKDKLTKEMIGRVTPQMFDRIDSALKGAGTPEARIQAIDETRRAIEAQKRNIRAGAGVSGAGAYDENLREANPEQIDEEPVR